MGLSFADICIRLLIASLFASIIGWEREFKNRPAGLRTHILVCVGTTIIAMIQRQIMVESLQYGINYPDLKNIIRSDPARLICQAINGVGFLGAGTIVVTKGSVHGLTTAASLWATAVLGLAIGMGYYSVAVVGMIFIFLSLTVVKKVQNLPSAILPVIKRVEIDYKNRETKEFIQNYFNEQQIKVRSTDSRLHFDQNVKLYTDDYVIEVPKNRTYIDIVEGLSVRKDIVEMHLL